MSINPTTYFSPFLNYETGKLFAACLILTGLGGAFIYISLGCDGPLFVMYVGTGSLFALLGCVGVFAEIVRIILKNVFLADSKPSAPLIEDKKEEGFDTKSLNKRLEEALWKKEDLFSIQDLVEKGADVNTKYERDFTPLHLAAIFQDSPEIVKYLIDNKADMRAKTIGGYTPIRFAANEGNKRVEELLYNHGADVDTLEIKSEN